MKAHRQEAAGLELDSRQAEARVRAAVRHLCLDGDVLSRTCLPGGPWASQCNQRQGLSSRRQHQSSRPHHQLVLSRDLVPFPGKRSPLKTSLSSASPTPLSPPVLPRFCPRPPHPVIRLASLSRKRGAQAQFNPACTSCVVLGKGPGPRLCRETPCTQSTWRGQPGTQLLVLLPWLAESKGSTFFFIRYMSKNTVLFGRHIREQAASSQAHPLPRSGLQDGYESALYPEAH